MIQMKPTTSALIRWTPMSPGITQMYKASKIGHWCLHNVPMVVIPHPDFHLNNGEAILAQLRKGFFRRSHRAKVLYFSSIIVI